jgi:hypothetical protein
MTETPREGLRPRLLGCFLTDREDLPWAVPPASR